MIRPFGKRPRRRTWGGARPVLLAVIAAALVGLFAAPVWGEVGGTSGTALHAAGPSPSRTAAAGQQHSASLAIRSHTFTAVAERDVTFQLEIATSGEVEEGDLSVLVAEGGALDSRAATLAVTAGGEKPTFHTASITPLTKLAKGGGTLRTLTLKAVAGGGSSSGGDLPFPIEGVYPVSIALVRSADTRGQPLAAVQSWMTFISRTPDKPLRTSIIWPIEGSGPGRDANDTPTDSLAADVRSGGRLRRAASIAASSPIPLTLQSVPASLSDLARAGSGDIPAELRDDSRLVLDTIRTAARRPTNQDMATPFARPPASIFTDPAFVSDAQLQESLGRSVAEEVLGLPTNAEVAIAPDGPTDEKVLQSMLDAGASRLLLRESSLKAGTGTTGQPYAVAGQGEAVSAFTVDEALSRRFSSATESSKPEAAYAVMAELAATYFESDGATRGVLVSPNADWAVPEAFSTLILESIAAAPFLRPVTASGIFDEVPTATGRRRGPVVRELSGERPGPVPQGAAFAATNSLLGGYESILVEPNPLPWNLRVEILTAEGARALSGAAVETAATLGDTQKRVEEELGRVHVPDTNSITLTSKDGVIPFRIENANSYPVRIRLALESEKLRFPDNTFDDPFVVVPPGQSQEVRVIADSTGIFPMKAMVRSPDSPFVVTEATLSVRSTGAGRAALLISIIAAGFLVLWWGREFFRSRRHYRHAAHEG